MEVIIHIICLQFISANYLLVILLFNYVILNYRKKLSYEGIVKNIFFCFFVYIVCNITYVKSKIWESNYHDKKIRWTITHDIRKYWTTVSTLLGLTNSVYYDLHHRKSTHCWWDLIRSKKLSSISVCHA